MKSKLIGMYMVGTMVAMTAVTTASVDAKSQTNSEVSNALVSNNIQGKAIAKHPWNQGARASLSLNGTNVAVTATDDQGNFTFSASPGIYTIDLLRHIGDTIYTGIGTVKVPADSSTIRIKIRMTCSFGC